VVVPNPETAGVEVTGDDAPAPASPQGGLFERSDFDQVFDVPGVPGVPGGNQPAATVSGPEAAPGGAWGTHAEPSVGIDPGAFAPVPLSEPRSGIVLSSGQLTMLTVGAVLLLAAVFGAGVLVGRYLLGGS
jgi:hypothetical protein